MKGIYFLIALAFSSYSFGQLKNRYINPVTIDATLDATKYTYSCPYLLHTQKVSKMKIYTEAEIKDPIKKVFGSEELNLNYVVEYDENGHISRFHNLKDGYPYDFFYDQKGRMAAMYKYSEKDFSVADPIKDVIYYSYDTSGNLKSEYWYYSTKYKCRFGSFQVYNYSLKKDTLVVNSVHLVLSTFSNPRTYKKQWQFDGQNRLIFSKQIYLWGNREPVMDNWEQYSYTKSDKGEILKTKLTQTFISPVVEVFTYNDRDKIQAYTYKVNDTLKAKYNYSYTDMTTQVDCFKIDAVDNKSEGESKHVYIDDEKGNKLKDEFTDFKNADKSYSRTYKYEFDKRGNWITCIETENGKRPVKIVRVLEYSTGKIKPRSSPPMDERAKPALDKMLKEENFSEKAVLDVKITYPKLK